MRVVYFARSKDLIKIGWSGEIQRRIANLRSSVAPDLVLLATTPGGPDLEAHLHAKFAGLRVRSEWFRAGPDLLAFIETVQAGAALFPDGIVDPEVPEKTVGLFTSEHAVAIARELLADAVNHYRRHDGLPKMEAYARVAEKIGASVTWVRKIVGERPDVTIAAHTHMNLIALRREQMLIRAAAA
jgi:hypothetical protein